MNKPIKHENNETKINELKNTLKMKHIKITIKT